MAVEGFNKLFPLDPRPGCADVSLMNVCKTVPAKGF